MSFQMNPLTQLWWWPPPALQVEAPLTFTLQEFEAKWKEVDKVWSQFGGTKKGSGCAKIYDCRFRKRQSSSKKPRDARGEAALEADLCEAQITVTLKDVARHTLTVLTTPTTCGRATSSRDIRSLSSSKPRLARDIVLLQSRGATTDHFKDQQLGVEFLQL